MGELRTTHILNHAADLAKAEIAAGLLLVECDPQPPEGAELFKIGDTYGWMYFTDNPDGLIIPIRPCPYKVGDVVELGWLEGEPTDPLSDDYYAKLRITEIDEPVDVAERTTALGTSDEEHELYFAYLNAKLPTWAWPCKGVPV